MGEMRELDELLHEEMRICTISMFMFMRVHTCMSSCVCVCALPVYESTRQR